MNDCDSKYRLDQSTEGDNMDQINTQWSIFEWIENIIGSMFLIGVGSIFIIFIIFAAFADAYIVTTWILEFLK